MGSGGFPACTWCMTHSRITPARSSLLAFFGCLAATGGLVSGCGDGSSTGGDPHRVETFPFDGKSLAVKAGFSKVDVRESDEAGVDVSEDRTAFGVGAEDPRWSLADGVLDLGRPCGGGSVTVGLCEITYTVTVPAGTEVDVQIED